MRLISCLGAALAAGLALSSAGAEAQTRTFDGVWSVEIVTDQGACDRAYRYSIQIENGRARYGGQGAFEVAGQVQANGAVSASIARGEDRATVTGRLQGAAGTGTWSTSGSRVCSGRWNAEKRS
jgi:hypothetical protein